MPIHDRSPSIHVVVRVVSASALALTVALALGACGGSSKAAGGSSTTAGQQGQSGPSPARRAAITACLRKQGITRPRRPNGGGPGAGILGGGPRAGSGRAAFQAALRKCGIQPGRFGRGRFRNSPAFRARLTSFAACMRANGVKLRPPNTSGNGPVFNTAGVNRNSPAFKAAFQKCRNSLGGFFGRRGSGATGAGGPGGAG